jgi:hypothetical protein
MSFSQQTFEKIIHFEMRRPMAQVFKIELRSAHLTNAPQIVPLPFGGFASRAEPFELSQNRILGCGNGAFDWFGAERAALLEPPPRERRSAVPVVP